MEKTIIIRPITQVKFSGLSAYSKTKTPIDGACLSKTGLYLTGLTSEEIEKYEKELSLPKGTLNPKSPYWGTVLKLNLKNDGPTYYTFSGALDEIRYKCILAHPKIANSLLEIKENPDAMFYIDDPESVAKAEEIVIDLEMEAMELMLNTSISEKRGLLRLYGVRNVHEMSESRVKTDLVKQLRANPKEFIERIKDKALKTKMLIEELIEVKFLVKKGPYFYHGDDLIGSSTDEMVSYLIDPKNQSVRLALESRLKKYRDGK